MTKLSNLKDFNLNWKSQIQQIYGNVKGYLPGAQQIHEKLPKPNPKVICVAVGLILGMCVTMGPLETFNGGVFLFSQAYEGTAAAANWVIEPKYTGQEDLPPGFRGEAPNLDIRANSGDGSLPEQCQNVDPSALVCSTVRVSGFRIFSHDKMSEMKKLEDLDINSPAVLGKEEELDINHPAVSGKEEAQVIFVRRAFDEIQGRAPFVSENERFLAFWCEKTDGWRLTLMDYEDDVRDGSCTAFAAASKGVQFKDSVGWLESEEQQEHFEDPMKHRPPAKRAQQAEKAEQAEQAEQVEDVQQGNLTKPSYFFEIQMLDGEWVPALDIACR